MPGKGSANKRHRQNLKRRSINRALKSQIHNEKKRFIAAVENAESEGAKSSFLQVIKLIDSAANKGILHKNTADRKKSRLHKFYNTLTE